MKVLILGAGQVGRIVAENLVNETNEISVIDSDEKQLEVLQERFDLRALLGDAASPNLLASAGAMDADILIAVTAKDETNLVACTLASQLFNIPIRIARVRNSELRHYPRILGEEGFHATSIIWPERAVASHLAKLIMFPAAQQVLSMADGLLTLFTVRAMAGASLVGRSLREIFIQLPEARVRFVSIYRRNHRLYCRPDTVIEAGDEVTVLTATADAHDVIATLHTNEKAETIVLFNGGTLSPLVVEALQPQRHNRRIKIFESNERTATELSRQFNTSRVSVSLIQKNDPVALTQEGIGQADVVLTLSPNEEANIMSALLAKRLGAKRTIVLLDRQVYSNIVYGTDIDVTVSLTQTSLGELLRHIRYGDVVSAQEMYRGGAEAIEIVAHGSQKS
ncbi:MAG TPA: Trk system potassium transporter TrkA, partial [Sutterella sp.]|nr:Trk system potassium transporter TrkA [Sutterella sp.]